ncbi:MAG TPA: DUF5009 domain-containing protein [Roseateles sp.]
MNGKLPIATPDRWLALDALRGLSVIGMVLSLTPGAWEHQFQPLVHVKWQGWHLIDMVSPTFLFCVGAALPLSIASRLRAGASRRQVGGHILLRALALVVIGILLGAYPHFDWPRVRLPGVLQRIGVCYALVGLWLLATARWRNGQRIAFRLPLLAVSALALFLAYWGLLALVPVPGFGAPRFDPVGSWPAYVDRSVFTVAHLFPYWPVDGQVVFDPDGLVSCLSCSVTVLLGALTALLRQRLAPPGLIPALLAAGGVLMAGGLLLDPVYPIVKNIWTGSFVLFSAGFSLFMLAAVSVLLTRPTGAALLFPARVYGSNPTLVYITLFLSAPLLDLAWLDGPNGPVGLRYGSQPPLQPLVGDNGASLLFAIAFTTALFLALRVCYRRRWFLKL